MRIVLFDPFVARTRDRVPRRSNGGLRTLQKGAYSRPAPKEARSERKNSKFVSMEEVDELKLGVLLSLVLINT